jgi:carbamate kinase
MQGIVRGLHGRYTRLVLTHGNGPQIGNIVMRSELAAPQVYPLPLDTCVSDSEGGMGYMIQQIMHNVLTEEGLPPHVTCVLTQVVVDPADPMWKSPTKFVGRYYSADEARNLAAERGWQLREDSGRGWRRVFPSPAPLDIIEIDAIRWLLEHQCVVIAAGGGGIPVVRDEQGQLHGVEAVIDKDHASALLALRLGVKTMVILTGVEKVALDYRKPTQRWVDRLGVTEAEQALADGQFPPGSMGPKIEATVRFLRNGGRQVIITSPTKFREAMEGRTGTSIEA